MGRRESPLDPDEGPVQRFAHELRELRRQAGGITYRAMARMTSYSSTTLADAAGGERLPSLAVALAYATACGGDRDVWEKRWQAAADQQRALPVEDDGTEPPYCGLRRFQPEDQERFFGRDKLTADLAGLVGGNRLTALVGASGSGKSSLLRAGLVPALRAGSPPEGWVRPAAVRILTPGPRPARSHRALFDASDRGAGDTVVIVDQFEEAFTLCQDARERADFVSLLLKARDSAARLRVVLAVRADFFGHLAAHRDLADALRAATLLVGPMTPEELREAIVKPAAAAGLTVERALTARLVREVDGEAGGLPLLSHVLLETWRRRQGRLMTLAAYEAAGGLQGAVAQSAEALYTRLPAQQRTAVRRTLLRLIAPGDGTPDTRRPADRTELGAGTPGTPAAEAVEELARARLVTLDQDAVHLTHEALITAWPRLRGWIDADRRRLRVHRQLTEAARTWERLDRDTGTLYRGVRLAEADEAFGAAAAGTGPDPSFELSPVERDFLTASRTAAQRERRRLRHGVTALSVLLCLALVAASVALWQRQTAVNAQREAQSRQLAAQSAALLAEDVELASLLAVQAYRTSPTTEAADSLYAAAAAPLRKRVPGSDSPVTALAFSPDGRTLAIGDQRGHVRLWDMRAGRVQATLPAHTGRVHALAFGPDGDSDTLATSGDDRTIRLWDTATGRPRAAPAPEFSPVYSLAFSPDGTTLAAAASGVVRLRDARTGAVRTTLRATHPSTAYVAYGPDGTLATASGALVHLWEKGATKPRKTFSSADSVTGVQFDPTGRRLAVASDGGEVEVWDLAKDRFISPDLLTAPDAVSAMAFSRDGNTLATVGRARSIRLWDVATQRTWSTIGTPDPVGLVAFASDGRTLATDGSGGTVHLWQAAARSRSTIQHIHSVESVLYSPDGKLVGAVNGELRLNDAQSMGRGPLLEDRALDSERREPIVSAAFSPDGRTIATGLGDGRILLWDRKRMDTLRYRPRAVKAHDDSVYVLAYSPDGRLMASGSADGTVWLRDARTGRPRAQLTGHAERVTVLAFSPDGRLLATVDATGTVRLWDVGEKPQVRRTLSGDSRSVHEVAFSPDGSKLAVADDDSVRLWDVATGRARSAFDGHTGTVRAVAFSPDGRALATGSTDTTARLWDVRTARARSVLSGHTDTVTSVAFSPDGRTLATGSTDATTRLWDSALPDPGQAIDAICRTVGRDLTAQERSAYAPDVPDDVCRDAQ